MVVALGEDISSEEDAVLAAADGYGEGLHDPADFMKARGCLSWPSSRPRRAWPRRQRRRHHTWMSLQLTPSTCSPPPPSRPTPPRSSKTRLPCCLLVFLAKTGSLFPVHTRCSMFCLTHRSLHVRLLGYALVRLLYIYILC
ncbi:hypothetical protein BRADI_4g43121v3 [Brachypodium distachyon]|uniref:Uncharacterized protein n=1 Tax=Brachypodium distachyon TaxID=15368 RepID=A0A0Q3HFV3_BRADI|nr:hypothetical protein BRADI_4g43121v3 [Brachypodium distachyon]